MRKFHQFPWFWAPLNNDPPPCSLCVEFGQSSHDNAGCFVGVNFPLSVWGAHIIGPQIRRILSGVTFTLALPEAVQCKVGGGGARFLDFIFGGATPSGVRHLFRALHTIWTLRICGVHRVRPPHNGTRRRIVWAAPPPFICPHSRAVPCLGRPVAGRGPPPTRPPAAQPGRQQGADRRPGCIGLLCNSDAPPPRGRKGGQVGEWVDPALDPPGGVPAGGPGMGFGADRWGLGGGECSALRWSA